MIDLYVSVSKVDEYRKMVLASDDEPWLSEDKLIKSIVAPEPLGWQAKWGEALQALIADGGKSCEYVTRDNYIVHWPEAIVREASDSWPKGCVFERSAVRDYETRSWRATVAGRIDAACGLEIIEGKARFGLADLPNYAESLQWRLYLNALPWARCVNYRIHEIGGMYADHDTKELRIAKDGPTLKAIHTFSMWRQPNTEAECMEWVSRFVEWAQARKLESYLMPREKQEPVTVEARS